MHVRLEQMSSHGIRGPTSENHCGCCREAVRTLEPCCSCIRGATTAQGVMDRRQKVSAETVMKWHLRIARVMCTTRQPRPLRNALCSPFAPCSREAGVTVPATARRALTQRKAQLREAAMSAAHEVHWRWMKGPEELWTLCSYEQKCT